MWFIFNQQLIRSVSGYFISTKKNNNNNNKRRYTMKEASSIKQREEGIVWVIVILVVRPVCFVCHLPYINILKSAKMLNKKRRKKVNIWESIQSWLPALFRFIQSVVCFCAYSSYQCWFHFFPTLFLCLSSIDMSRAQFVKWFFACFFFFFSLLLLFH